MQVFILILVIAACAWVGWTLYSLYKENKFLFSIAYPITRYIFIKDEKSKYMEELYLKMFDKLERNQNIILSRYDRKGYHCTKFKSGCEIYLLNYAPDAELSQLKGQYKNKIFIDDQLPQEVVKIYMQKLGLMDYMVEVGFCSKETLEDINEQLEKNK